MAREQRGQAMLPVVHVVQLEHRLAGDLTEPDDRLDLQRARPLDLAQQPGRLDSRQLRGRGDVEVHGRVGVALQVRRRHRAVDIALHRPLDDGRLVLPCRQQRDLPGLENGRHPHRDGFDRHVLRAEEVPRRHAPRDRVEHHEPRAGAGARPRLVEPDVAGLPDPQELEIDAAGVGDRALVVATVSLDLVAWNVAAGDVHVLPGDVHVVEEVLPHEPVVAVQALGRHRVVLVEVEGHDVGEIETCLAMQADQLAIDANRRGAGRKPQHRALPGIAAAADDLGHAPGDPAGDVVVRLGHDDRNPFLTLAHTSLAADRTAPICRIAAREKTPAAGSRQSRRRVESISAPPDAAQPCPDAGDR